MKANPEKPQRKLQLLVSETARGTVIREKLGNILLWRKESDSRNKMYFVEIRKLICKHCGHLIELHFPKKLFKSMGEPSFHSENCDNCHKTSDYKFGEGQLVKGVKV